MKYRLILKQQQESQQAKSQSGEDLSTPTLLAILGCSGILALNYIAEAGQQWMPSLAYLMSLAMVASLACQMKSRAVLTERTLSRHREAENPAENDERYAQTCTTPILSLSSQETNKTRIEHKSVNLVTSEPCLQTHYLAFFIASVITLSVTMMLLADWLQLANSSWFARLKLIPADIQTTLVLVGVVAVAAIINQLRKPACRAVFDKASGLCWLEHILVFNVQTSVSAQMPIGHIIALQQLDKSAHTRGRGFSLMPFHTSCRYEVNIVFKSTERVNLLQSNSRRTLAREVTQLASFLEVPVWKQTSRLD